MTRFLILLIFQSFILTGSVISQEAYTIQNENNSTHLIQIWENSSYFIDEKGNKTVAEITQLNDSLFLPTTELNIEISKSAVLWKKIQFYNPRPEQANLTLKFCELSDSVLVYTVGANKTHFIGQTGSAMLLDDKPVYSVRNYFPISVLSGQRKTILIANYFSKTVPIRHLKELSFTETKTHYRDFLIKHSGQAFYAGLMIMFSLISFFTFALVRNRSFIYFGLVHLAFMLYFIIVNDSIYIFAVSPQDFAGISLGNISITLLILTISIFIAQYLQLREKNKKIIKLFIIVSIVTAFSQYPLTYFVQSNFAAVTTHNIIILIWILTVMIPVIKLSLTKYRSAVTLLIALSLLVLSGLIYLLALTHVLPLNFFTKYSIQLASVLFSLLVFYDLFRVVNEINAERQHAISIAEIKTKFYANISHEFRTPLTLIKGPLNDLLDKGQQEDKPILEVALKNTDRLMNMINQLMDLSKIEAHQLDLKIEQIAFVRFIRGLTMSFESLGDLREVDLNFSSEIEEVELWVDTEKMEIIWTNLISNAFKFSAKGDQVSVRIKESDANIILEIEDTGIGIHPDSLPYVFDRFFRAQNDRAQDVSGSGIGLNLVKELLDLLHAEINVKSVLGEGSVFTITLLKGKAHFNEDANANIPVSNTQMSSSSEALLKEMQIDDMQQVESINPQKKSKPTILLVEDNDDVQFYIKNQLIDQFNVITANNGQEGIDIALTLMPELIISDVMMPIVDGLTLCKTLKEDLRTSHIPIILLTAKAGNEPKIEGLELGADEYLTKPFIPKELNIRVKKMIELRVQLRKRLLDSPTLQIKSVDGNPIENKFVNQLGEIIGAHLENPQFGVEKLASEIGLSTSQLNRKLKSITDLSANKYIRHIRLKKAMTLLETENLTVAEVSFKTGFNSDAYFVKCFRETFGETPGSFQKKK